MDRPPDAELFFRRLDGQDCPHCSIPLVQPYLLINSVEEYLREPMCLVCQCYRTKGDPPAVRMPYQMPEAQPAAPVVSRQRLKKVRKQERSAAAAVNGRVQPGSGCGSFNKADVRAKGRYRIECKSTKNKSFPLSLELLEKVRSESRGLEVPVLDVEFVDARLRSVDRWVAIPFDHFEKISR